MKIIPEKMRKRQEPTKCLTLLCINSALTNYSLINII